MKPDLSSDDEARLLSETVSAIQDAVLVVHGRTGLPVPCILAALLGGVAGHFARTVGFDEAAERCAKLSEEMSVMAEAKSEHLATVRPVGYA